MGKHVGEKSGFGMKVCFLTYLYVLLTEITVLFLHYFVKDYFRSESYVSPSPEEKSVTLNVIFPTLRFPTSIKEDLPIIYIHLLVSGNTIDLFIFNIYERSTFSF